MTARDFRKEEDKWERVSLEILSDCWYKRYVGKLIQLAKSHGSALIIGLSLIIGLNFKQFVEWAEGAASYATYHLSGQASADEGAREQAQWQQMVTESERAQQEKKWRQAEKKQQQAEAELKERKNALYQAWQDYLIADRSLFIQISVIQDTQRGDYVCLQDYHGPWYSDLDEAVLLKRMSDAKAKVIKRAQAQWTYETRDRLADGFVQWLNSRQILDKSNWQYSDLQNSEFDRIDPFDLDGCLGAKQVWRANRYGKHIE